MGSPAYIYKGLSVAELMELRAQALARMSGGDITSLAGAQKSSSREFKMSPQDMLAEVNYALGQAGVSGFEVPPQTIYQDFRGLRPQPGTVTR